MIHILLGLWVFHILLSLWLVMLVYGYVKFVKSPFPYPSDFIKRKRIWFWGFTALTALYMYLYWKIGISRGF